MPLAESHGPFWTADEKEPHPFEFASCVGMLALEEAHANRVTLLRNRNELDMLIEGQELASQHSLVSDEIDARMVKDIERMEQQLTFIGIGFGVILAVQITALVQRGWRWWRTG